MPRNIYNEGRVVGFSAYATYVKQHLAENPDIPPASEREWLAASIGAGSSLILQMPNVAGGKDKHNVIDIQLPDNSRLGSANTILCQFFDGTATIENNWATKITSYGDDLISNTLSMHPSGIKDEASTIDHTNPEDWNDVHKKQLRDYMKIFDGVVIQPGKWDNTNTTPAADLSVDLSKKPRIRLHVKGSITSHPLLLLTGFTIRSILLGTTGQDGSTNTASPEDGDFLGPAIYPWANKITFVVPNSYIVYFAQGDYTRQTTPDDPEMITVTDTPLIDMKSRSGSGTPTTPAFSSPVAENYYSHNADTDKNFYPKASNKLDAKKSSRVSTNVNKHTTLSEDGEAVLTVYQRSSIFPPALYSTFVAANGQNYLHPVDNVAPGSVKMFNNADASTLINYETTFPGTTAMNKTSDGTIQILDSQNNLMSVADIDVVRLSNSDNSFVHPSPNKGSNETDTGDNRPYAIRLKVGKKSVYLMPLSKDVSGTLNQDPAQSDMTEKPGQSLVLDINTSNSNISWAALMAALTEGRALDLLEARLKNAKQTLIENQGYLEFGPENNKLRLYISDTAPSVSDVPVGSIGIGWGFIQD